MRFTALVLGRRARPSLHGPSSRAQAFDSRPYASLMIAAGVNAKALSTYMGHSSITITYDRYGHLMPGNEDEAIALVDKYLERASVGQKWAREGQ